MSNHYVNEAWRVTLRTGRDPEGLYTLGASILPKLRAIELAELQRLICCQESAVRQLRQEVHNPDVCQLARRLSSIRRLHQERRLLLSPSRVGCQSARQ